MIFFSDINFINIVLAFIFFEIIMLTYPFLNNISKIEYSNEKIEYDQYQFYHREKVHLSAKN